MIKNAFCCVLFSSGTPMLLYGDEVMRTQKGNNNAYCQDNELTWFNWDDLGRHSDIFEFYKKAISFRKAYPILRRRRFFTGEGKAGNSVPDVLWFGKHLDMPHWHSPKLKTVAYQLAGSQAHSSPEDYYLFLVFNMHHQGAVISLPKHEDLKWYRLIDTSRGPGDDFRFPGKEKALKNQEKHHCDARSVVALLGERHLTGIKK